MYELSLFPGYMNSLSRFLAIMMRILITPTCSAQVQIRCISANAVWLHMHIRTALCGQTSHMEVYFWRLVLVFHTRCLLLTVWNEMTHFERTKNEVQVSHHMYVTNYWPDFSDTATDLFCGSTFKDEVSHPGEWLLIQSSSSFTTLWLCASKPDLRPLTLLASSPLPFEV